MLLSIGMIVKNEERYLDKCLNALKPIVNQIESEIIIVDTGSTDKTVEIAKKYTDKVYYHKWNDDFASMRNKVLSYCSGKWFFSIDADEIIYDATNLINFFGSNEYLNYNSATIDLKNYTHSDDNTRYTIGSLTRLFKRSKDFKYVGKIHEQPLFKLPIKKIDCIAEHYGYISDDNELMERKFNRNKKILEDELLREPNNVYLRYQVAVNYGLHKELEKALEKFEELYNSLNIQEKKIYKYVVTEYAQLLLTLKNYKKCEDVCIKELGLFKEDQPYKIDLTYYLAKSQLMLNSFKESITSYNKYFELVEKNKKSELILDPTITIYTLMLKDDAYKEMLLANFQLKDYKEALQCSYKIENEDCLIQILNIIIKSYISLDDLDGLYGFYKNIKLKNSELLLGKFQVDLENEKLNLSKEKNENIEELFSGNENIYEEFNSMKFNIHNKENVLNVAEWLLKHDINEQFSFYGDFIYILMKGNYNLIDFCSKMSYDTMARFLEFCNKKHGEKFVELLYKSIKDINENSIFDELRVKIVFLRVILILDESNGLYIDLFKEYVKLGIKFIRLIYSEYVVENEMILEMKNSEHKFFMHMMNAEKLKNDELEYVRYLRKALNSYPYMKCGVEWLLDNLKEKKSRNKFNNCISINNKEIENLKKQLINNINILITCDKTEEAKVVINEYEKLMGSDKDLLLLKSQLTLKSSIKQ